MMETMAHYPAPFDEARTRRWIDWNLENYEQYGFGLWAVVLKDSWRNCVFRGRSVLQNSDPIKNMGNGRTIGREKQKNGPADSGTADGGRMIYDEA